MTIHHMSFILILIIIAISSTSQSQPKSIDNGFNWPIWVNVNNEAHFKFFLGKTSTEFMLDISQEISSIKESLNYNINTLDDSKLLELSWNKKGSILVKDSIKNDDSNFFLDSFTFVLQKKSDDNVNQSEMGIISLSRSQSSLMNQMYNNHLITKRIISFEPWKVQIGGFTASTNDMIYYTPMIESGHQWATAIKGIIIGKMDTFKEGISNRIEMSEMDKASRLFERSLPLIFDIKDDSYLTLPYSFVGFFHRYFYDAINRQKCRANDSEGVITFECEDEIAESIDVIYLLLKGVAITINHQLLFTRNEFHKMRTFFIKFKNHLHEAIFEKRLLLHCSVVFNEEEHSIGFPIHLPSYLLETSKELDSKDSHRTPPEIIKKNTMSAMMVIIDIIGLVGLGHILVMMMKMKKSNQYI